MKPKRKPPKKKTTRARARPAKQLTKPDAASPEPEPEPEPEPQSRWPEAKLTDEMREFVVSALACFDNPMVVRRALLERYGVEITHQSVEAYDPTKYAGRTMAKKWRELFAATRAAFLEEKSQSAISSRVVRMRWRERLAQKAETQGNLALAKELLNDAAKEEGGAFTNARVLKGAGEKGEHTIGGLAELFGLVDGKTRTLVGGET